jgi:hypothetical protein
LQGFPAAAPRRAPTFVPSTDDNGIQQFNFDMKTLLLLLLALLIALLPQVLPVFINA